MFTYIIYISGLISEAIKKLECGKSAGPDGVYAESTKFAHPRLHVLLSICFSLCFTHRYMPADMMETTIELCIMHILAATFVQTIIYIGQTHDN